MQSKPWQTIIIPHRNRHDHLWLCLNSIAHSAGRTGRRDFEVIVVDDSDESPDVFPWGWFTRVIHLRKDGVFNKSRMLNVGIDAASGDAITILDVDAIVGCRFLESANALHGGATKVCYRVKCWPMGSEAKSPREMFASWDALPKAFEAYGTPTTQGRDGEPHGNSQLSVLRSTLGDIRFDEDYFGHGREDMDFNMQLWVSAGDGYTGHIWTDADHAMIHLSHLHEPDWRTKESRVNASKVFFGKWYDTVSQFA